MPAQLSAGARSIHREYRSDIDGLRTLAIVLVVLYHVWFGRVSGGVDVFLMISAFLLTGSLARRAIAGTPLKLGSFWNRRFRRLVPAAAVTLLAVLVAVFMFFSPTRWATMWTETLASLFYVQNWQLAFSEIDYYARDSAQTSPLQHFWSLSVQGQVFILWPLLIGLVVLAFRRRRAMIYPALIVVFGLIFVASLWFSIVETRNAQTFAYFDTRTRLWEFAAGSLLALLLPLIRLGAVSRGVLGWGGLVGIVACGAVLDVQGGFPGYLALWPILCTAAVIVAGAGSSTSAPETRFGPSRVLSSRPFAFLSKDAYALYLVHWPILVVWMVITDTDRVGVWAGSGIILLSLVAARILSRGVELPLRGGIRPGRADALRGIAVIGLSVAVVVAATGGWRWAEKVRAAEVAATVTDSEYPGASQVDLPFDISGGADTLIPLPTELDNEWAAAGPACSGELAPTDDALIGSCNQTPFATEGSAQVLVIGDSHAQQLAVPLLELSASHDFEVITLLQGGCTPGLTEESRSLTLDSCEPWARAALDYAVQLQPTAVYLVATRSDFEKPERLVHGIDQVVEELHAAGITVFAVRDNPRFGENMYSCALERRPDCGVPLGEVLATQDPGFALDGVLNVDFTPWLCPDGVCQAVIGNVAVYIDSSHLSRTYALTLAPILAPMILPPLEMGLPSG